MLKNKIDVAQKMDSLIIINSEKYLNCLIDGEYKHYQVHKHARRNVQRQKTIIKPTNTK